MPLVSVPEWYTPRYHHVPPALLVALNVTPGQVVDAFGMFDKDPGQYASFSAKMTVFDCPSGNIRGKDMLPSQSVLLLIAVLVLLGGTPNFANAFQFPP